MQLYNALSQQIEDFSPIGDEATIYVCGITPYDTTHLGHAFLFTIFDVLIRFLEYSGIPVRYAQNVTDIDDDILKRARESQQDWFQLGNDWTRHFIEDNIALNNRPPDFYPRATEVIPEIIAAVQALLDAGVAYEVAGNVYFHVASDPDYGQLSRLKIEEMLPIANERGNNPEDANKRDPLDFVLWQAQSPGEPSWPSPWGPGRPGWHIECSTMSEKFLGLPIDIHGGGTDLMFPHHESEIAQAECANNQRPFSRFWVHVAMVHSHGEKMSKSLGNLVMVRDLLDDGYQASAIRLCMCRHHYRQAWNYDEAELDAAVDLVELLQKASSARGGKNGALNPTAIRHEFLLAMADDLNTPKAIEVLEHLARSIIDAGNQQSDIVEAQALLAELSGILGLRLENDSTDPGIESGWNVHRQRFEHSE